MGSFNFSLFRIILVLSLTIPFNTGAQVLEEVIVTAQKREQNLQEIGISVTAYTGDQLMELGLTDTVDLTTMTPGLQYTVPNAEGSQINFFLRGVGLNEVSDANENPVAVYYDGVYRAAMGGLHLQMFDMERAEVLRGPQGTLFGRNASGGLIHFISKKPTEEFEAYIQAGLESFGTVKGESVINGAITDNLLARVSLATNQNSGYVDNRFTGLDPVSGTDPGDFNETNAKAGRLQLLWKASEDLETLIKFHYSYNRGQVGGWQNQPSTFPVLDPTPNETFPNGVPDLDRRIMTPDNQRNVFCLDPGTGLNNVDYGLPGGTDCFGYRDSDGDPHAGEFDRDGDTSVTAAGISVQIDWDLGWAQATSISAFDHVDRTQEEDTDSSPTNFLQVDFNAIPEQFTQELRLSGEGDRYRWQTGFYYFNWDVEGDYNLNIVDNPFVNPTSPYDFAFDVQYKQDTESWSFFGQGEYDLTDQFTLIAGIRYTEEEKEMDYSMVDRTTYCPIPGLNLGVGGCIATFDFIEVSNFIGAPFRPTPNTALLFNESTVGDLAKHDRNNVTALVELDWKPNDDLLIYGKYSRGVKSAGFNATFMDASFIFFSQVPETVPFGDETLTSYEAGFKATLFGGTTRLNASAFYYDYEDFQTFRFEFLSSVIFNTDAEIYGGEIELQTSPWEGWDFLIGASFLDATAEDIPATGTGTIRDTTPVAAPDVTVNGMARYQWDMYGGSVAAIASFFYQDEIFYDIQNYDISLADSYIVGNFRLQWLSPGQQWNVAAFVNNIADEEYITYTFDFTLPGGFNQLHYGKPRWFGGSVRYSWQ